MTIAQLRRYYTIAYYELVDWLDFLRISVPASRFKPVRRLKAQGNWCDSCFVVQIPEGRNTCDAEDCVEAYETKLARKALCDLKREIAKASETL